MTLIAVDRLRNSGEATETEWAESLTGEDLDFFTKTEDVPVTIVDGVVTFTDPALLEADYFIFKNARTWALYDVCLLYTSPSPRDRTRSRMPSSA